MSEALPPPTARSARNDDVDRALARWVEAGLIEPGQRDAILDFERSREPAHHRDRGNAAQPAHTIGEEPRVGEDTRARRHAQRRDDRVRSEMFDAHQVNLPHAKNGEMLEESRSVDPQQGDTDGDDDTGCGAPFPLPSAAAPSH